MTDKIMKQTALDLATQSPCSKRKVGAVICDVNYKILGRGYNYTVDGAPCEDAAGATRANVIHAEVAAVNEFAVFMQGTDTWQNPLTIYTTHAPCVNCRAVIENAGICNIV